ncbi:MAG: hypothetical protein WC010_02885 [Candidatus Absconditabacterales bacterium]
MKFNNFSAKTTLSVVVGLLSILGMISFAADPSFSISPASFTGKLHCEYDLGMIINPNGMSYNAFQSTIRFESGYVLITPVSINPIFNGVVSAGITSGFLYEAYGTMAPGMSSTTTIEGLTFKFKTLQNLTSTNLLLTTLAGGTIFFDPNTTDDGAVLNSSINSFDILTGVNDGTYTFVPLPCIPDTTNPTMGRNTPTNGSTNVPDNYTISFVLYDFIGSIGGGGPVPMTTNNDTQHYRYSGNNTSILSNYVPAIPGVDNQEGVNSGTISVTVSCPTCSGAWSFTTPSIPSVSITERTGDAGHNMLTRQNKIRGYTLSFPAPAPYEIEKLVTVNISVTDNPNEDNTTHTGTPSFSFNTPQNPTIARISPAGSSNISTTFSPLIFTFTDNRAGIDTGTISITIAEYSSGTKFYTGYTYSGNELSIILTGGSPGTGNSGSYQVSFAPLRAFPSFATIEITGSVYDLAGNPGTYNGNFTTTKSCADLGCADFFTVNVLSGINIGVYPFTGTLIQITGTNINSPYPYLTGLNNDILMCGFPYTGTILTGNVGIFDTTGTQINGILYTGLELYITGLNGIDFTYSNGVISIQ